MTVHSTPVYFDPDVELEKEYLEKLKTQRIKTQRLFHEYKALLKERQVWKQQRDDLQNEVNVLRHKDKQSAETVRLQVVKLQLVIERLEN